MHQLFHALSSSLQFGGLKAKEVTVPLHLLHVCSVHTFCKINVGVCLFVFASMDLVVKVNCILALSSELLIY